ncbi:MAG: hypothetical protein ACXV8R_02270 [Acidimicrobiia bacterium]
MSTSTAVHLRKDAASRVVDAAVRRAVAQDGFMVGAGHRTLRRVLAIARREGLEIRDPDGHLLHHELLLSQTHGAGPRRDSQRPWRIQVMHPTFDLGPGVAQGIQEYGPRPVGRRVIYAPGGNPDPNRWIAFEA